jgi:hypothetical protein
MRLIASLVHQFRLAGSGTWPSHAVSDARICRWAATVRFPMRERQTSKANKAAAPNTAAAARQYGATRFA